MSHIVYSTWGRVNAMHIWKHMKKRGFGDALNMDSLYSMYSSEKRRSQYGGLTEEKRTPCILGAFVRDRVVTRGPRRIDS